MVGANYAINKKFRVVPKPRALVLGFSDYILLSLNGYLAAVLCGNDPKGKLEVGVMKEYGVMNSWVKDFTIASYVPKVLKLNGKCDDFDELDESTSTDLKIIRNGNCSHVVCVHAWRSSTLSTTMKTPI